MARTRKGALKGAHLCAQVNLAATIWLFRVQLQASRLAFFTLFAAQTILPFWLSVTAVVLLALTPLTIGRNRFAASLLGSLWGLGHSTGQLFLGLAFALLKERFTAILPFLERWAGTIVALTLISIGALGIYESFFEQESDDTSCHDDEGTLREIAARDGANRDKSEAKIAGVTFATGILYGLQPDALFVVIPALALPSQVSAFSYCVMFVIGTVLAMGGYTLFIGTASEELCRDRPWLQRNLSVVASAVAIFVGLLILLAGAGLDVPLFG